jgi:hypothetical protein
MSSAAAQSPVAGISDYVRAWADSLAQVLSQGSDLAVCEVLPRSSRCATALRRRSLDNGSTFRSSFWRTCVPARPIGRVPPRSTVVWRSGGRRRIP